MMERRPFFSVRLSPSPASKVTQGILLMFLFAGGRKCQVPHRVLLLRNHKKIEADADFYQPQEPTAQGSLVSVLARCYRQQYHPALWRHILGQDWVPETASEF